MKKLDAVVEILSRHREVEDALFLRETSGEGQLPTVIVVALVPPTETFREQYAEKGVISQITREFNQAGLLPGDKDERVHLLAASISQIREETQSGSPHAEFWRRIERDGRHIILKPRELRHT